MHEEEWPRSRGYFEELPRGSGWVRAVQRRPAEGQPVSRPLLFQPDSNVKEELMVVYVWSWPKSLENESKARTTKGGHQDGMHNVA